LMSFTFLSRKNPTSKGKYSIPLFFGLAIFPLTVRPDRYLYIGTLSIHFNYVQMNHLGIVLISYPVKGVQYNLRDIIRVWLLCGPYFAVKHPLPVPLLLVLFGGSYTADILTFNASSLFHSCRLFSQYIVLIRFSYSTV